MISEGKVSLPFTVKAGYEATLADICDPLLQGPRYLWTGWAGRRLRR